MAYGKHMRQVEPLFFADVWTTTMHMYNIYIYIFKTYPYDFPWNFQIEWSNKGYRFSADPFLQMMSVSELSEQGSTSRNKYQRITRDRRLNSTRSKDAAASRDAAIPSN